ncbi:hypothetical protein FKM82_013162 [Ascaphus truei]
MAGLSSVWRAGSHGYTRLRPLWAVSRGACSGSRLTCREDLSVGRVTLRASHSSARSSLPTLGRRSVKVQTPLRRSVSDIRFNMPPSAENVARPAGVCTMMRLPFQESAEGLDAAFIGVPLDTGTSNRPGARFGPRHIRAESSMVRRHNSSTGAAPFHSIMVADIGDVNVNLYNLEDSCRRIREAYQKIMAAGCVPLTLGNIPIHVAMHRLEECLMVGSTVTDTLIRNHIYISFFYILLQDLNRWSFGTRNP